jgi:glutathione synthase/RimK-type ligase-like ATP-grasp enzyme
MQKVLILSGLSSNGRATPYAKYFSPAIDGCEFTDINFDHLVIQIEPEQFKVTDGRSGTSLDNYDLVMIREFKGVYVDIAYVVGKYLKLHKTPFFNENYLNYRPVSKIAQMVAFYEQGINFPATYLCLNAEPLERVIKQEGPLVVKDTMGMHGSNNFLIKSKEELHKIFKDYPTLKFIVQEYHPNAYDYRVLIMGDRPPLQIKRTAAKGSHLNNTSQGGKGEVVEELPPEILSLSKQLAEVLEISVGGVDVLKSQKDQKYYFLEVNSQPQIVSAAQVPIKLKMFKDFLDDLSKQG